MAARRPSQPSGTSSCAPRRTWTKSTSASRSITAFAPASPGPGRLARSEAGAPGTRGRLETSHRGGAWPRHRPRAAHKAGLLRSPEGPWRLRLRGGVGRRPPRARAHAASPTRPQGTSCPSTVTMPDTRPVAGDAARMAWLRACLSEAEVVHNLTALWPDAWCFVDGRREDVQRCTHVGRTMREGTATLLANLMDHERRTDRARAAGDGCDG